MNLKVPGAILPLGCAILSTRAITVRGVGTTPLRRTRVNVSINTFFGLLNQEKLPKLFEVFIYILRTKPPIKHLLLNSSKLNVSLVGLFLCTSEFLPVGFWHQLIGLKNCFLNCIIILTLFN